MTGTLARAARSRKLSESIHARSSWTLKPRIPIAASFKQRINSGFDPFEVKAIASTAIPSCRKNSMRVLGINQVVRVHTMGNIEVSCSRTRSAARTCFADHDAHPARKIEKPATHDQKNACTPSQGVHHVCAQNTFDCRSIECSEKQPSY